MHSAATKDRATKNSLVRGGLSTTKFSFAAPIHFLQKSWGEVDKISGKFISCELKTSDLDGDAGILFSFCSFRFSSSTIKRTS